MAKIDLARRAEIGRERRARTRALILNAGEALLAERPAPAITVDAVAEAAGIAKGTFYYHFQNVDELATAVGAKLSESFNELLATARLQIRDPIERLSFAFAGFLKKAASDHDWARLVVQNSQSAAEFIGVRASLKADIADAILKRRVSVLDADLAVDIVIGVWLQVTRGVLERDVGPEQISQALEALLRALGARRDGRSVLQD
jgi:AcrR family transcriptional regulator